MATMYYEKDGDLSILKGKTVGIIGYGSQGHAHANNLKESGATDVCVALRPDSGSAIKATEAGFEVLTSSNQKLELVFTSSWS